MAYMSWTDAYSIGVPFVDEEHRELMGLINDLHEALHRSAGEAEIKKIFERLTVCTSTHFWHEENRFEGTDFPRAAIHANKHKHLLTVLACFKKGVDRTGQNVSFDDQCNFLRDWLLDHISHEDMLLGGYLNDRAGEKSPDIVTA